MKQTIKELLVKVKSFVTSRYFPFVAYGLVMLAVHFLIPIGHGDDGVFVTYLGDQPSISKLMEVLGERYQVWSSRLLIEAVLFLLVHVPLLWRFLDTLLMIAITVMLSSIFNEKKSTTVNWAIVLLVLAFPFKTMDTAGWMATTLNYSWPLALGLFALLPLANHVKRKKTPLWMTILSFPALLFAANQEQMCAVLLAVSGVVTLYLWRRDKKIPWLFAAQVVLCAASMIFILTCPGNSARTVSEIGRWFPEFAGLSLFQKLEIGYSSSLYEFLMKRNPIFLAFCALLAVVGVKHKRISVRVASCIPLGAHLVFGQLPGVFGQVIPHIVGLNGKMTQFGTGFQLTSPTTWLPDIVLTVVVACILIALFFAIEDRILAAFSCVLFLVGFASRVVMGFSPTVWASSTRTFIFMYFSLIGVSIILFNILMQHASTTKKAKTLTLCGIGVFAAIALDGVLPFLVA